MACQTSQRRSCSLPHAAVLIALFLFHGAAAAMLFPIVPLPISFNFGGASPMIRDVSCSWGSALEFDGARQVRQGCGAARYAWRVVQESAGAGSGSEVALGPQAASQQLTLSLAPNKGQGVLSRSGTYLVQLSISYERCDRENGQTRVRVGPCPSGDESGSSSSLASVQLQPCKDVTEPGKRRLSLNHQAKGAVTWQLNPSSSSSSSSSSGSGVSTEAGAAQQQQPLSCSGSSCVLLVGSGAGRVQPGRSYAVRYTTGDAGAAAAAPAGQQQQQQGVGLGVNLGVGGFAFGIGAGSQGAAAPSSSSGGGGWRELKGPQVDKCPPRVTRSAAGLMGSCGSGRWLEMQAAAVDVEEGPGGAATLKYYWYVLSARTQDVVQEASGPSVTLEIGQGGGSRLPEGRRYLVNLLVTTQAGGQVSSSRETVGSVIDVPAC